MSEQDQSQPHDEAHQEDRQYTYVCSDEEREAIREIVQELPFRDVHRPMTDEEVMLCKIAARRFPARLVQFIEEFRVRPDRFRDGYIRVRNLPVDPIPGPTPGHHAEPICKKTSVAENVILCLSVLFGEPFVPGYEQKGRTPALVAPEEGKEEQHINGSSSQAFGFHVENLYDLERRPHGISLFCVRPDPLRQAKTTMASIYNALPKISVPARQVLRDPHYEVTAPLSFEGKFDPIIVPALAGTDDYPILMYRAYNFRALDEEAAAALDELNNALAHPDVVRALPTVSGDFLLLDNLRACHGRTSFQAFWDERAASNRYLLRVFTTQNWNVVRESCYPGTHVLDLAALVRIACVREAA